MDISNNKQLVYLSIAGNTLFVLIFCVLHFLRPDKNPCINFVSEYAIGKYAWLATISFYALSIAQVCMFVTLRSNVRSSGAGIVTFSIWISGAFLFSTFKTDLPNHAPTFTGLFLHGIAALVAFLSLAISMVAWGLAFKKHYLWYSLSKKSVLFGVISCFLFILFLLCPVIYRGLAERILICWDIIWLLMINIRLLKNIHYKPDSKS